MKKLLILKKDLDVQTAEKLVDYLVDLFSTYDKQVEVFNSLDRRNLTDRNNMCQGLFHFRENYKSSEL